MKNETEQQSIDRNTTVFLEQKSNLFQTNEMQDWTTGPRNQNNYWNILL